MKIIDAMGHAYDPDLNCAGCGDSWAAHQEDPKACQKKRVLWKRPAKDLPSHCRRGHSFAEFGTTTWERGHRRCNECLRLGRKKLKDQKAERRASHKRSTIPTEVTDRARREREAQCP